MQARFQSEGGRVSGHYAPMKKPALPLMGNAGLHTAVMQTLGGVPTI